MTGVSTQDELLVRRARDGDRAACEELFRRHRNASYRLAYRYLGHEQDALDVVQEAMIKAFSALAQFDGRSGYRTWLLRIVRNAALDWGRRRGRLSAVASPVGPAIRAGSGEGDHDPGVLDDPSRRLQRQDLRDALYEGLDRLSATLRETFILFAELGMSYKDIAEVQDVPVGTVMSRIHAARAKLQADLDWDRLNDLCMTD
ncbi:MAG: sigma-70 family RNA polymerase sigma factor [Isosphaeraceae bacterium]